MSRCLPERSANPVDCYATIGQVGNLDYENVSLGRPGEALAGPHPHVRAWHESGRPPLAAEKENPPAAAIP